MRSPLLPIAGALALLAALVGAPRPADATPIAPSAFGALAVFESFEGLAIGPNVRLGLAPSLLEPGTVSAYAFASGALLTAPIPNPGHAAQGAFVHDFALGTGVTNNWGSGRVVDGASDIPFGSAYLGAYHPGTGSASIRLTFPTVMDRVGAYVTGLRNTTVRLDAYDAAGVLLESHSVGTVNLNRWNTNFLGIQNLAGIHSVVFSGADFGLDGLRFEPNPMTVPEPGTLQTVLIGLVGLLGLAVIGRGRRPLGAVRIRSADDPAAAQP